MVLVVGARLPEARRLVVVGDRLREGLRRVAVGGVRPKDPAGLRPVVVGVRPKDRPVAVGVSLPAAAGDSNRSDSRPAVRCTTGRFSPRAGAAAG